MLTPPPFFIFVFLKILFIYLAMPNLSDSMQDLPSLLLYAESLVVACKLLVKAFIFNSLIRDGTWVPYIGSMES